MKIRKIISLIIAVVLMLTCSGCALNFFSVESLLSPPMQDGNNGEVQAAFNEIMKDKIVQLKTPVSGEYQSSFVLFDINGDEVDEAMVFYSDSSVEGSVRMALLECIDEEWFLASDVKGAGSGVFDISFNDMNNDGTDEVFVSWSLYDSKTTRIVSVYQAVTDKNNRFTLESLGNEYCSSKSFADFNGDRKSDMVLVYLDDTKDIQKSFLRLFSLSENNELVKYGELLLDSAITSVAAIQCDTIRSGDNSYKRLFIDCQKNDRIIFTEMVYWDIDISTPVRAIKEPAVSTARSSKVLCRDIDSDGNMEIPVITGLQGDEKQLSVTDYDTVYTFTLLDWLNVYGDGSLKKVQTLLNPLDMYLLKFPWNGDISVKYDAERNELVFCEWSVTRKTMGDKLFSIAFREKTDESYNNVLYEYEDGIYYYDITESGESYGITEDELKASFIKIN